MRDGEITEAAWAVIEPLLPPVGRARGRWRDHRQVLEGIVFKFRTGVLWRDLPERFGPWQTVHGRFAHWAADGTFDKLLAAAQGRAEVDWLIALDSTIVRLISTPRRSILAVPGGAGRCPSRSRPAPATTAPRPKRSSTRSVSHDPGRDGGGQPGAGAGRARYGPWGPGRRCPSTAEGGPIGPLARQESPGGAGSQVIHSFK
ncbi:transposase [Streptomyces sp. NRRL S-813]|uniref:transposase n=1 Tax=Streptomyces sp. NRRL S-813 TaxID=1463919 RepID=UPI003B637997